MKIMNDRTELNAALNDAANVFMLLFGQAGSKAEQICAMAETSVTEGWRQTVLIQDTTVLTPEEKTQWFSGPDTYTTVSKSRATVDKGPLTNLCFASGNPEPRKIKNAFDKADEA